ncbi:MAG TPA: saccharopine dehydrogenase NADP-binding domain-containing protein [Moraxellaceae bacterium]|nr:saccharopine dehydrogenase NADP-binding domain-containing protein [Moraxellaceae bacterium]
MTITPVSDRPFDVIVYGAASFVGKILTRHLLERHGEAGALRWALAGRNAGKLEEVKRELGMHSIPLILADATDDAALRAMAAQARVVVSTVGPYALHGSALVAACAELGTDYCDLTGEVPWMRRMIDQHQDTARRTGARIVHTCGFDSIPSDMGVWFTQREAQRRLGEPCVLVRGGLKAASGGFSGGTVASMTNVLHEAATSAATRALLRNPYALSPDPDVAPVHQHDVMRAEFDADLGLWRAPFVMSGINSRVVLRSHALANYPWGRDFRYDESMLTGRGLKGRTMALGITVGLGGMVALLANPLTRPLLERLALPAPGTGPSPEAQARGFFDFRFHGVTRDHRRLQVRVTGDRDPGYGSTGKMLGEAAVCLALDVSRDVTPGGFWTPSTAMGEALLHRLTTHAGLGFAVVD